LGHLATRWFQLRIFSRICWWVHLFFFFRLKLMSYKFVYIFLIFRTGYVLGFFFVFRLLKTKRRRFLASSNMHYRISSCGTCVLCAQQVINVFGFPWKLSFQLWYLCSMRATGDQRVRFSLKTIARIMEIISWFSSCVMIKTNHSRTLGYRNRLFWWILWSKFGTQL